MNPALQEILHNITTRLAVLEESVQSNKLLIDLVQEQRAEIDRLRNQMTQPEQDIDVGIDVAEFGTHIIVRRGNEIIHSEFYHAPKREFVGLTDEEIVEGQKQSWVEKQAFESAVWWAEEKLRSKNT